MKPYRIQTDRSPFGTLGLVVVLLMLTGLFATAATAVKGIVQTRSGTSLEGQVALGVDTVEITMAEVVRIPLADIEFLALERRKTPGSIAAPEPGLGLLGLYYGNTNFSGSPLMRLDQSIDFNWNSKQSPMPGLPRNHYGVRWLGFLAPTRTDTYTVYFGSDDGGRMWVDGRGPIISSNRGGYAETNVTLRLEAGKTYSVRLEYLEAIGSARARLHWSSPRLPKSIIPGRHLIPAGYPSAHPAEIMSPEGLLATYYTEPDFKGRSFTRVDPGINETWSSDLSPNLVTLTEAWRTGHREWQSALTRLNNHQLARGMILRTRLGKAGSDHEEKKQSAFDQRLRQAARQDETAQRQFNQALERLETAKQERQQRINLGKPTELVDQRISRIQKTVNAAQDRLDGANATLKKLEAERDKERALLQAVEDRRKDVEAAAQQLRRASLSFDNVVAPGIPRNFFSVRWSGRVLVTQEETVTFHVSTDEPTRLWLDDELVLNHTSTRNPASQQHSLAMQADTSVRIRMETQNTDAQGHARLEWSSASRPREPIPPRNLHPAQPSLTAEAFTLDTVAEFPTGVVLQNGLTVVSPVVRGDRDTIRLEGTFNPQPLPTLSLCRIHFQPLSQDMMNQITNARPGLLLTSRDYIEGDFRELKDGKLTLSSVLFGIRKYDVATEVVALVVRSCRPATHRYVVKAQDEAAVYANELTMGPETIGFPEMPGFTMKASDLWQIQWVGLRKKR